MSAIISFILVAVGRGPAWWPDMSIPAFILSGTIYVVYRIVVGRARGKGWTEILSDGWKPTTGSIWLDALVFAGILVGIACVIWWAMWYL